MNATGLGLVDLALLEAVEALGAGRKKRFFSSQRVLDAVQGITGVTSDETYGVLQRLVQPWHSWLLPLDGEGNFGTADDPAVPAEFTEVALNDLGRAALAAERGETGALPIGLCNGTLARGGVRPPFAPADVVACLRGDLKPTQLAPTSPNGCLFDVDLKALRAGRKVELTQRVRTEVEDGRLVITAVPLGVGVDQVARVVLDALRTEGGPTEHVPPPLSELKDVRITPTSDGFTYIGYYDGSSRGLDCRDETDWRVGTRIVITPGNKLDLAWLQTELLQRWPLLVTTPVQLPGKLPDLIRDWADRCGDGQQLDLLERA